MSPDPLPVAPAAVTGRTSWDAVVELARQLGAALPWLLLLGGLVYLAYTLKQDKQEAVDHAHEELRKTYTQISELTKNQISNIQSLDGLQQNINKNTLTQIEKLRELEKRAGDEMKNAETQRQAAEQAKKDFAEIEAKSKDRGMAIADFEKKERDYLQRIKTLEDEMRAKASERSEEITSLRLSLEGLADKVLDQNNAASRELAEAANAIRGKFPADVAPKLVEFATATEFKPKLLSRLVGLSKADLLKAIQEVKEFQFWEQAVSAKSADYATIVGAVKVKEDGFHRFVTVILGKDRVTDVMTSENLICVVVRDNQDWSRQVLYRLEDRDVHRVDSWVPAQQTWSLPQLSAPGLSGTVSILPIKGGPAPVFKPLTGKELDAKYPKLAAITYEEAPSFAESLRMEQAAEKYEAATVWKSGAGEKLNPGARAAVSAVLEAAVKLDDVKFQQLARTPSVKIGRLAALALRPSFQIVWANEGGMRNLGVQTAPGPEGGEMLSLIAEYRPGFSDRVRSANLFLERQRNGTWILASLDEWADAASKK